MRSLLNRLKGGAWGDLANIVVQPVPLQDALF